MDSVDDAASGPKPSQKLVNRSDAGDFRVGQANAGNGVSVAAGDANLAQALCQPLGGGVRFRPHLAVAHLESRHVGREPVEVVLFAAACESGKHVIHAKEKLTLGEVHQERYKIVPAALNFGMIAFGDAIDSQVHLAAAGHPDGDLFAEKEVGVTVEDLGGVNGV